VTERRGEEGSLGLTLPLEGINSSLKETVETKIKFREAYCVCQCPIPIAETYRGVTF